MTPFNAKIINGKTVPYAYGTTININISRKPNMILAHLTAAQTWVDWWYINGSEEIKKNGYIIKSVKNTCITFGTVWYTATSACEYWIIY